MATAEGQPFYAATFGTDATIRVHRSEPWSQRWERRGGPGDPSVVPLGTIAISIGVSPDGTVGVAFEAVPASLDPLRDNTWVSFSRDGGATWTKPEPVSYLADLPGQNHFEPDITADARGGWHLAWLSAIPFATRLNIHYARLEPGATEWTTPVRVNPEPNTVEPQAPHSMALAADADGHAYVAWGYSPVESPIAIHVATTRQVPYDPLAGVSFTTIPVTPNPSTAGPVTLSVPAAGPGAVRVRLFDAKGRLVTRWESFASERGVESLTRDGRDARGRRVPSGVYHWDVETPGDHGPVRIRARAIRVR